MRKLLFVPVLLILIANVCIADELQIGKNTSIGLIGGIQFSSQNDWLKAKEDIAKYLLSTDNAIATAWGTTVLKSQYKVTVPGNLLNYGVQLNHRIEDITFSLRGLLSRVSSKDTLEWRDSAGDFMNVGLDWKLDINDIGILAGYTIDNLIFRNSRDNFGIGIGNYAVTLKESDSSDYKFGASAGTLASDHSYSNSGIYYELRWQNQVFLSKSITLDSSLGYKMVPFTSLGNYTDINGQNVKFNFSGINLNIGASYWF